MSTLVWAVITLDPLPAVWDLEELIRQGNYLEAHHAAVGLRYVWDDLPASDQEAIRTSLRQRRDDRDPDDWRAGFIDEILIEGGWTPEQRAARDRGETMEQ